MIVVDDASTDSTRRLAEQLGARTLRVEHRKISAVRNAGAGAAGGELLFFVDADTQVNPPAVSAALAALRAGAAGGGCVPDLEGAVPLWGRIIHFSACRAGRLFRLVGGCCLFCTRAAYTAAGGFSERLYAGEDIAFVQALKQVGRFVVPRSTVITSARKLRVAGPGEVVGLMLRIAIRGPLYDNPWVRALLYGQRAQASRKPVQTASPQRAQHLLMLMALAATLMLAKGAEPAKPGMKTESFDHDPGWEAYHNRVVPTKPKTVVQDFGYSPTHYAGKAAGEMGGQVWRASEPAYYADRIGPRTLDDKLSASGSFAITKTSAGGLFFGFFRASQTGAGGRPVSSLGLDFDSEASGARLAVRLITGKNQSCGTFVTPFIPGKFRPTPIRNDGTRYTWKLDYDPQAAGGRGRFTFSLTSAAHQPGELERADLPESYKEEARRRFPSTTEFSVELPEGFKQQGTTFDHFGLMNMMKPGGFLRVYFDDLQYEGHAQDFTQDPHWDAAGNRVTYQTTKIGGAHDFGFSNTSYAGGQPGEVGGTFWRSGEYAYYADPVGPFTLEDRLEASGRVVLQVGAPDSDMFIGWFNSTNKTKAPAEAGHFLGVHVGGPTRVGHYFQPSFTTAKGEKGQAKSGPVLEPGKVYHWSLVYEPRAQDGQGAIQVTLGDETVRLVLKPGMKAQGASFDRFGMFNATIGGQVVRIFLDDLQYTAARPAP